MSSRPLAGPARAERAIGLLQRLEDTLLAVLLGAMVVLASLQIALRSFFDAGLGWGDPLLRAGVLWIGLLGALAASRDGRHIQIDVLSHLLPERWLAGVRVATSGVTIAVCALIAWHASRFLASEIEFGSEAFSGIPAWTLEIVIPVSFAAIALRYLRLAATDLRVVLGHGGGNAEPDSR